MLHISTIKMEYHIDDYYSSCLGPILLSTCFIKSVGNTHQTHTDYDCSVYWLAFCLICNANFIDFEDPIDICLEIVV